MPAADDDPAQPPWADAEVQPPPTFDDLHAPERMPYTCAECGREHEAVLEDYTPLGNNQVKLNYRAVPCTNTPINVQLHRVEGGPVVREAKD